MYNRQKSVMRTALLGVLGLLALVAAGTAYWVWVPHYQRIADNPAAYAAHREIHFFALGDQGSGKPGQWRVAYSMEQAAQRNGALDFVTLLGDNFYSRGIASTSRHEWVSRFENVYSGQYLGAIPFFAVLGNHDYMTNPQAQVEYSQQHLGSNRWRMPARYYRQDFGVSSTAEGDRPLLRIVFIDTLQDAAGLATQAAFIEQQFAEAPAPVWKVVIGHYPVRSHGKFTGMPQLLPDILPAMQRSGVDLYMAGHDHNQQVIAHEGEPLYVISGGGGKDLYAIRSSDAELRFSQARYGFVGVDVTAAALQLTLYDIHGKGDTRYALDRACTGGAAKCLKAL